MTTVTYNIPGINCGHCEHTIKMEVGDLEGVQSVEASSESKTATVAFDAPATEQGIKDLLAEINYPAVN
ncbi:MAG: heavy-metal-associated domain-containing protein [Anaerolineales bacterium]|nr:heavy-metal-associated domain-containing protein [Anaerolineales bacterium]